MKKGKKLLALSMAALLMFGAAGCGEKDDGKVKITVSGAPSETNQELLDKHNKDKKEFMEKYPNIQVESDVTIYDDAKIFMTAAASQTLPTMYATHFTDTKMRIEQGYAADITELLEGQNLADKINPDILDFITDDEGRIYGVPTEAYAMGIVCNKKLFTQAGLVNEDGTVKFPKTYEEMAEYAKIIKEKTGVPGFAIGTTGNFGGWHFMNIAWSYGVNFMKQDKEGNWKATFDTPEAVAALQYIKDLKWKYNALPEASVIDANELFKLFGTGQVAMHISKTESSWSMRFGMDVNDISLGKIPAGPKGRYAQTGGKATMFAPNASKAELEAALKWLDFNGNLASLNDEQLQKRKETLELQQKENGLILPVEPTSPWVDADRLETINALNAQYANVDIKDYEDYLDFSGVTLRAEEPVCAQELYAVLDSIIQEVIVNKDADCAALIKKANSDFQKNHLDQI